MRNWFHEAVGVPMFRAVVAMALPVAACLALLSGCTATMSVNPLVPEKQSQPCSLEEGRYDLALTQRKPDDPAVPLCVTYDPERRLYYLDAGDAGRFNAFLRPLSQNAMLGSVTLADEVIKKVAESMTEAEGGFVARLYLNVKLQREQSGEIGVWMLHDGPDSPSGTKIIAATTEELADIALASTTNSVYFFQIGVLRKSCEDALPEPFGVPLGKKVADEQWMTGEDLEWTIVTNSHTAAGLRRPFSRYAAAVRVPDPTGRERLPPWSRDLPPWRLARPFLGRTDVKLHVGADGAVCGFSVSDALRGDMTRAESLAKIRRIREDVERECGFPLGEFVFRSSKQEGTDDEADTVADEALGPGLWLDLRAVVATSVTTRNGLRVSIKCNLYAPDANGDRGIPVKVSFVAVEARRRAEEATRAQDALVKSRIAAMDAVDFADLCGVASCLPQGTDTNGLERVTLHWCDGTSDDKADVVFWLRKVEEGLPAPFFRSAEISYSYKTLRPYTIELDGGFPDDMSPDAVFRALDEFALSLNARYGIGLGRGGMGGRSADRNRFSVEYSFLNDNVSVHLNVRRHDVEAWRLSMTVTSMKYRKLMRREGEICGDSPQTLGR